jgi:hypothetical protein
MKRKFAHHADWFIVGLYVGLLLGLLMLWVMMSEEVTTSHTIAPNDLDEYFINYDLEVLKIDLVKN